MKKVHRFLLPGVPSESTIRIEDPGTIHLIKNVLKLTLGESCIVFSNGSDDFKCTVTDSTNDAVILAKEIVIPKKEIKKEITACISITKRDTFELIVQKLTEIGVHTIVPILSDRTIKQSLRIDRLQKISDEALEQSGQSHRVHITPPLSLIDALTLYSTTTQCYFDMEGEQYTSTNSLSLTYYIGPEGGWSDGDNNFFAEHTLKKYTLGVPIFRADTAAIVAAYTLLWQ